MKIRTGFVSNSSTTSFLLVFESMPLTVDEMHRVSFDGEDVFVVSSYELQSGENHVTTSKDICEDVFSIISDKTNRYEVKIFTSGLLLAKELKKSDFSLCEIPDSITKIRSNGSINSKLIRKFYENNGISYVQQEKLNSKLALISSKIRKILRENDVVSDSLKKEEQLIVENLRNSIQITTIFQRELINFYGRKYIDSIIENNKNKVFIMCDINNLCSEEINVIKKFKNLVFLRRN